MSTVSIGDAKDVVYNALEGMGHDPINLVITEIIADSPKKYWTMKGKFQSGFMGESYRFDSKYDPSKNGLVNIKVTENTL